MSIYATVLDSAGNFVAELAEPFVSREISNRIWKDFLLTDSAGNPLRVDDFRVQEMRGEEAPPLSIALVLDYSGSMSGDIGQLESAVRTAVREKRPQDRLGVIKFDNRVVTVRPVTADSVVVDSLLGDYGQFGGATALYDACLAGISRLAHDSSRRPVLVVFTDGEDNSSLFSTASDVAKAAEKANVSVFAISFGGANRYALEFISEQGGGRHYEAATAEEFAGILREIFAINKVYYRLTFKPRTAEGVQTAHVKVTPHDTVGSLLDSISYNRAWNMEEVDVVGAKLFALFPFDKHRYYYASENALEIMAAYLKAHPEVRARLIGHTDLAGDARYNLILSRQRAARIARDLRRLGVPRRQVMIEGRGEREPVNRPDYPSRLLALENRRVEVLLEPMP